MTTRPLRARARAHDLDFALDRARSLVHARVLVHVHVPDLDFALDRALDRVHELVHELDRARSIVRDRDLARGLDLDRLDRDLARDHCGAAQDLARDLGHDLELDLGLHRHLDRAHPLAPAVDQRRVRGSARRLAAAARLLPAADRARFAEEFACELWELAHDGASRRGQAAYALRQLRAALVLRGELLAPRRRKAGP